MRIVRRRGAALAAVLMASGVLLVVCLSMATLSVLNLNMARSYHSTTQARLLAQAAVAQVTIELEGYRGQGTGNPLERTGAGPDLVERFRRPVFPTGSEHLGGTVQISFAPDADHYSVDNLESSIPAASWADRDTDRKSVPPFSISLVIGATVGGQTTWFEALLRRRWPYALCTPGRVTLMGTPDLTRVNPRTYQLAAVEPSLIKGLTYSLLDTDFDGPESSRPSYDYTRGFEEDDDDGGSIPSTPPESPQREDTITVGKDVYDAVFRFVPKNLAAVTVGGQIKMRIQNDQGTRSQDVLIISEGNRLSGKLDLMAESSEGGIAVAPANRHDGGLRSRVRPADLQSRLVQVFAIPAPTGCVRVARQDDPAADPDNERPPSEGGAPDHDGVAPPAVDGSSYFYLRRDLVLGPDTGGGSFRYGTGARYVIDSSAGNRWIVRPPGRAAQVEESGAGIELRNALLHVRGNLDLSAGSPDAEGNQKIPTLRGTNATIIVDGTLVLTNGAVDAQDQGMVIYCRRLVSQARGHYKGLLMVKKSAVFFPPTPGERLKISGGIICGDSPIVIQDPPRLAPRVPGEPPRTIQNSVQVRGVRLWSTDLTYDARYLKTMHPLGALTMMSLRQLP